MATTKSRFYWGVMVGGVLGFLLGTYLSTEQGKEQLDSFKARTVELTGDTEEIKQRAADAAVTVTSAVGDALQEGISAARRRRQELARRAAPVGGEDA